MTKGHETKPKISFNLISHLARASRRRGKKTAKRRKKWKKKEKEKKSKIKVCCYLRIKCIGFLGLWQLE